MSTIRFDRGGWCARITKMLYDKVGNFLLLTRLARNRHQLHDKIKRSVQVRFERLVN